MDLIFSNMNMSDLEEIKNSLYADFDNFWTYETLKEELNSKNLYNSLSTVANDIAWGAATGPLTDIPQIKKFVNKIAYFNSGWFKPQKLISGFASKYTIKKSLHELVEGTVDECLSVLLSPTEVSNLKAGNVQLPIIESNCS